MSSIPEGHFCLLRGRLSEGSLEEAGLRGDSVVIEMWDRGVDMRLLQISPQAIVISVRVFLSSQRGILRHQRESQSRGLGEAGLRGVG